MAIYQTITALPDPPQRSAPADFDTKADAWVDALEAFGPEANQWIAEANSTGSAINSAATTVSTAQTTAQEAADAAVAQGSAALYSAATTYSLYAVCIGSDGRAYRALVAGNHGIDPVTDLAGKWLALNPDPHLVAAMLTGNGVFPGWAYQAQDPVGNYPPTDAINPEAAVWSRGIESYRALLTYTAGGDVATARLQRSTNAGISFTDVSAAALVTLTYSAAGAVIAAAWSA